MINTQWVWRDGVGVAILNNIWYMFGGWNPTEWPVSPNTTNEFWRSTNGGVTWEQLADAPWSARHVFGYCVKDDKIWVFGGDFNTGSYMRDIWTWDSVSGWVEYSSDWGDAAGDRVLFSFCLHNNEIYIAGGQNGYATPTMYTDVLKLVGTEFVSVGSLPVALEYFSTGVMASDGSNIFLMAGGRYMDGGLSDNSNNKVYMSTNNGVSISQSGELPAGATGLFFGAGCWFYGGLFYSNGSNGTTNQASGIWKSSNYGQDWTLVSEDYPSTHGGGICTSGSVILMITGNQPNTVAVIRRSS